jgi:hypothetical protein
VNLLEVNGEFYWYIQTNAAMPLAATNKAPVSNLVLERKALDPSISKIPISVDTIWKKPIKL